MKLTWIELLKVKKYLERKKISKRFNFLFEKTNMKLSTSEYNSINIYLVLAIGVYCIHLEIIPAKLLLGWAVRWSYTCNTCYTCYTCNTTFSDGQAANTGKLQRDKTSHSTYNDMIKVIPDVVKKMKYPCNALYSI